MHYCRDSCFGPYWSITRFEDIRYVDTHHDLFSSDGAITIGDEDVEGDLELPMFIAMDPPVHDAQRKVVAPVVAPMNLKTLAGTIRERAGRILDSLPAGETFDWVEQVSVVLTGQMLATLFDMPLEDRLKLSRWSDVGAHGVKGGIVAGVIEDAQQYQAEMQGCVDYFTGLWNERIAQPPRNDLISMLAHGESTRHMSPQEFLG
ncbi:MAG: cytochrome P450, partial [Alphaproteobacteria bacterium]